MWQLSFLPKDASFLMSTDARGKGGGSSGENHILQLLAFEPAAHVGGGRKWKITGTRTFKGWGLLRGEGGGVDLDGLLGERLIEQSFDGHRGVSPSRFEHLPEAADANAGPQLHLRKVHFGLVGVGQDGGVSRLGEQVVGVV